MRQTHIIQRIARLMRAQFPEVRTILYGSQARNTATQDSDIDLLILQPDSYTGMDFVSRRNEIMNQLYDIEIENGIRISPLVLINKIWKDRVSLFTNNVNKE
ncbi:MAG: nucleotidyltransferase domain-containing protein, partial [Muribaculaceae bacterium]|nr:nucleotidyltransferase domain-containing protein [Muribaculaceae bacterium]